MRIKFGEFLDGCVFLCVLLFPLFANAMSKIGPVTSDARDPYVLYFPTVEEPSKLPRFSIQYDDSQHFDRRDVTVSDGTRVSKYPSDYHGSLAGGVHFKKLNFGLQIATTLGGHGYLGGAFQYDLFNGERSKFGVGGELGTSRAGAPAGGIQGVYAYKIPLFRALSLTPFISLQLRRFGSTWDEERKNGELYTYPRSEMRTLSWGLHPIIGAEFAITSKDALDRIFLRVAGSYEKIIASEITYQKPEFADYSQKYGPFFSITLGCRWGPVERMPPPPPVPKEEDEEDEEDEELDSLPIEKTRARQPPVDEKSLSLKKWYLYGGIGIAIQGYDSSISQYINSSGGVALDLPGFYLTLANEKTILGGVVNGTFHDTITKPQELRTDSRTVQTWLIAASAMHFFGRFPGDGLFLRGDLGPAALQFLDPQIPALGKVTYWGAGLNVGGGYSVTLNHQLHLLVTPLYGYRNYWGPGFSAHFFMLQFGGML